MPRPKGPLATQLGGMSAENERRSRPATPLRSAAEGRAPGGASGRAAVGTGDADRADDRAVGPALGAENPGHGGAARRDLLDLDGMARLPVRMGFPRARGSLPAVGALPSPRVATASWSAREPGRRPPPDWRGTRTQDGRGLTY